MRTMERISAKGLNGALERRAVTISECACIRRKQLCVWNGDIFIGTSIVHGKNMVARSVSYRDCLACYSYRVRWRTFWRKDFAKLSSVV